MPFEDWAVGEDLFNTIDREHDLLDRDFRAFAEECDQLKGIQIFTGADDAWAGFAARYIDRLRDEFGKKNIWTWALDSGGKADRVLHSRFGKLIRNCTNNIRTLDKRVHSKKELCKVYHGDIDTVNCICPHFSSAFETAFLFKLDLTIRVVSFCCNLNGS